MTENITGHTIQDANDNDLECLLKVNETLFINKPSSEKGPGFKNYHELTYAGMPSNKTFSIYDGKKTLFYRVAAEQTINVFGKNFEVLGVNANEITLNYNPKEIKND